MDVALVLVDRFEACEFRVIDGLEALVPHQVAPIDRRLFLDFGRAFDLAVADLAQQGNGDDIALVAHRVPTLFVDIDVRFEVERQVATSQKQQGGAECGDTRGHQALLGPSGTVTPIMQSRVTRPASSASLMPSVPAGRMGNTM